MITPFDFLRSRTIWYFALIFAIYLFTGCNNFWTACTETPDEAFCQESANTDGGDKIDQTSDKPIGPTRKFEWRAKVPVDPNMLKYVGMKGTTPVFLANDGAGKSRWVAYQLDLLQPDFDQRLKPGVIPMSFPLAPGHDFVSTSILVSGSTFYMLSSSIKTIRDVSSGQEIFAGARLPDSPPYVYFRHPELDSLAVTVKPTIMSAKGATLIRWEGYSYSLTQTPDAPATALVMGDLDASDPAKNGTEVIWFEGSRVQAIWHRGVGSGAPSDDPYLKTGLQEAIDRFLPGNTAPILGGFVANLNDDKFVDFVYVRGSKLYVTSYIGRSASGVGLFVDWPKDSFPTLNGETVKSIQAIDLTKEGYPELVVETDQAVHFYLSIP